MRVNPTPCLVAVALALASCGKGTEDPDPPDDPPLFGDGVFESGCPAPGEAFARVIDVDATLPGEAAVGTAGDLLLANEHVAFAITDAVGQSTYWYYGGAVVDGSTLTNCVPTDDKLDDLGFVLAEIDLGAVEQSIIRAFRADRVEVVADGADGGPAIVRATGTDDTHWLVEHTLINDAVDKGGRPFSQPWGTEVTLDYILHPGSKALQIDLTVTNPGPGSLTLFEAALITWGETLNKYAYASQRLDLGGFGFDAGIPWFGATDGLGAYAYGADDGNLALMSVSGVNVLVDLSQITNGAALGAGQSTTVTRYLAVGDGGVETAVDGLLESVSSPLVDQPAIKGFVAGTVADASGSRVESTILVETRAPTGDWDRLDRVPTDPDGAFGIVIPDFAEPWDFRVTAEHPGRDDSPTVEVVTGQTDIALTVPPAGLLDVSVTDQDGAVSPARIHLVRSDGLTRTVWYTGVPDPVDLPPGDWSWTATRGYEYRPDGGQLTVPADGIAALDATVTLGIDTSGWMSIDTHVHSSDSPDSDVDQAVVLQHGAAHGLDVVLHTEHEAIVDRHTVPAEAGVESWVNNAIGEEVTSVGIEHMTSFPLVPEGERGGPVVWYGLDIDELFGAMRERSGGGVNLLNHPGYLDRIGWDRVNAAPSLTDPTLLALPSDAPLWSWNVDGIEVMNGHNDIFIGGNRRFDNWMSMVNAGHPMVAVGCSDDHGGTKVGVPRTYVDHPASDHPADADIDAIADAFKGGRAQASAGAFARVDLEGAGLGELADGTAGLVDLNVLIEAIPEIDVSHFVVFANCDMVDSVLATDPYGTVKFDGVVPLNLVGDTQVVIAAFGQDRLPLGLPNYDGTRTPRVLTSPIYVDGDGDGVFSAPGGRECVYDLSVDAAL